MATTTSPPPEDRSSKRMKQDDAIPPPEHDPYPPAGPPPPYGYPPYPYPPHHAPPPQHWQQQPPPHYPSRGDWNYPRKIRKKPDEMPPDPYYGGYPPYPPPAHYPPPAYASQGTWTGKPGQRDDYSRQSAEDDGASSSAGGSKEKGRGSYKCGRCGVPKKGHICPYQPKVKRRPDEPPPETRNAAVQVEMDEFMTIRRLHLKIQGLPESYVSEPYESSEVDSSPV